ncbi:hypothetical protein [uncultured Winogradskyella sp.]|uniref:hypothetical protein n=1 Tax=uncultured Winogradskyella sp. TaxID=395353 RepID=UPI002633A770|nr:hypothetical protein [uncultured Winogradskyella sp.]
MKKKIGYTLLTILVLLVIVASIGIWKFNNTIFREKSNYLDYTFGSQPIHFDWAGDSIAGIYEAQAALIIPLKIKGFAHQFYMQFDTGAYDSFIYENNLKSLRNMGLDIKEVVKDDARYVEHLDFMFGDNHIKASMIKIYPNYGHSFNRNDTISRIGIGTIGSDFMENRITSIDFKNQKIQLFNQRPDWMTELPEFKSFDYIGRRIMLPVTLDNKDYEFLYDSGCSAFGLITIKSRFDDYTKESTKQINYDAKSWESSIPIRSKTSDKLFGIGNTQLSLKRVSYVDMYSWSQPLVTPFTRIGGWLGNQPFNESTLILDTKAEEFIVITK